MRRGQLQTPANRHQNGQIHLVFVKPTEGPALRVIIAPRARHTQPHAQRVGLAQAWLCRILASVHCALQDGIVLCRQRRHLAEHALRALFVLREQMCLYRIVLLATFVLRVRKFQPRAKQDDTALEMES